MKIFNYALTQNYFNLDEEFIQVYDFKSLGKFMKKLYARRKTVVGLVTESGGRSNTVIAKRVTDIEIRKNMNVMCDNGDLYVLKKKYTNEIKPLYKGEHLYRFLIDYNNSFFELLFWIK